ncbi:hypothetical protein Tco_1023544 [Tanacetum coccineum]
MGCVSCESTRLPKAILAFHWLLFISAIDGDRVVCFVNRERVIGAGNRGKAIVNSSAPIYDQELATVTKDDEMLKEKEIDKLVALISLFFNKIYKPTNNNLRTSSNTSRANQDNSPRINKGTGYENPRVVNVVGARENVAKDDTDDESDNQEFEAHYMYMEQIQEVTPDIANISGPIFDVEPLQKVQNDDNYNVFDDEREYPEQPEFVNEPYPDMCYDREHDYQDDTDELAQERDLLASLIEKLKCEIDDSKNRNKFLESSNQALVDKLKGEIEDFKTKNKSLESSNNHFKDANNELSKINQLMFKDLKKFQAELDRYNDVNYASKVAIDCAKAKGDLMSYKIESKKSSNEYTRKINDLNQTISDMKKELFAHQKTISIMSQEKEAQIKFYKTGEDKELDKVIALENKVKVLDDIVYKIGPSVQTMNILNHNCKTSFAKLEFHKKAQRANPCLYDIGCYNDNLALMLAPKSDESIRLDKESRSKLSDLIRPFDYDQLNNLYDLFVPQQEKSPKQHYFPRTYCLKKVLPVLKNTNVIAPGMYKVHTKPSQTRTPQLPQDIRKTNKCMSFSTLVIPTTSVSRPQLKSNQLEDRVMPNNSQGKKQNVEDHLTAQILPQNVLPIFKNTNVIAPGMYKVHTKPNQTRTPRLPQDIRKTNKRVSFSTGVIPTTSVSRPQLKSNQLEDRVMSNNSQGKKQEVEDHRRNFKFSNNKTSVTACNDSLNAKTSNVNFVCVTCGKCVLNDNHDLCVLHYINGVSSRTRQPIAVPISTREPKHNVNQSVATSSKKTVATDSTVKKSRHITRKLYEQVSKTCSWWYPKYTPPGYNWKPKSQIGNVNPNISMPLGNASRTANILEHKTPRCSTVSNTPLSSNSFAARRDNSIHRRLWVLKAHDWKSQTSN